jgi:LuxR family transcriptional regulator, maltose regulon positive regulatory protein
MEDVKPEQSRIANSDSPSMLLALRESEVLRFVTRGYTNQHIGYDLLISVGTVKKHVRIVICKLGVSDSDRTQAVVQVVELGVLDRCKEE